MMSWRCHAKSLQRIGAGEQQACALQTMHAMRRESWWRFRGTLQASKEQLVRRLQDWCRRAEASGIRPLAEFSRRLRCYA